MTIDDIKTELEHIKKIASDDESAHSLEDQLHKRFIQFIAGTADENLAKMAREVLKSSKIQFERWCA